MTLGGIAAAIGLVIDDAIVVVEAIYAKIMAGLPRLEAVQTGIGELLLPLVGSTLTPVVVFIPLAFLEGITGVFFRALALTMVVALLTSLVLAITLTPSLAAWFLRDREHAEHGHAPRSAEGGFLLTPRAPPLRVRFAQRLAPSLADAGLLRGGAVSWASEFISGSRANSCLRWTKAALSLIMLPLGARAWPKPIVSSTSRRKSSRAHPDIESYSRRTGAALGFEVVEPNTGDFLVKLKPRPQDVHRRSHCRSAGQVQRRPARYRVGVPRNPGRPDRRPDFGARSPSR